MILAGDIGGTKTVLALFAPDGDELREVRTETFPSRSHATFDAIVAAFLTAGTEMVDTACFGVAGPVAGGRVRTTNLPWILDEKLLEAALRARRVKLLNDLEAAAFGMIFLPPERLRVLNEGDPARRPGNVAVVAAGTGLGEAILFWDGERHHPIPSEGGHATFSPRTDQEIALLHHLRDKFGGHVSFERVLSGPGLVNVYSFLRDTGFAEEPAWLAGRMAAEDPGAVISQVGLAGEHPLCVEALRLFCTLYGVEAGNLALECLAAEVFIGGGIAPKILPALESGAFLEAFSAKGRMATLLRTARVSVVLEPRVPLLGAARYALRHL
ncbi:MAG: glucokinase [Candidatus Binatia bacterium]